MRILSDLTAVEVTAQPLPAPGVVPLQLGRHHGEARWPDDRARFEHERHRIRDVMWLGGIRVHRSFESRGIGTVTRHAVVERGTAGRETLGLRVIDTCDEPHELAGDIAM